MTFSRRSSNGDNEKICSHSTFNIKWNKNRILIASTWCYVIMQYVIIDNIIFARCEFRYTMPLFQSNNEFLVRVFIIDQSSLYHILAVFWILMNELHMYYELFSSWRYKKWWFYICSKIEITWTYSWHRPLNLFLRTLFLYEAYSELVQELFLFRSITQLLLLFIFIRITNQRQTHANLYIVFFIYFKNDR